ncbi:MAG: hypothetical protein HOJ02_05940 [Rhodospirillaceae bacterium]|nr:hypothetical protein [Rhodospirillaceae bacterium]
MSSTALNIRNVASLRVLPVGFFVFTAGALLAGERGFFCAAAGNATAVDSKMAASQAKKVGESGLREDAERFSMILAPLPQEHGRFDAGTGLGAIQSPLIPIAMKNRFGLHHAIF